MLDHLDPNYRPETYFRPQSLQDHLLSKVKGSAIREYLQGLIDEGRRDEVVTLLASGEELALQEKHMESIHPAFMSGNYLSDLDYGEVEIGRIWINSTTGDVTCVYAKAVEGKIYYRVVDEYEGETLDGEGTAITDRPMTLGEFVDFFFASWSLIECIRCNFEYDQDGMMGFFRCESEFYPQFDQYARILVEEAIPPIDQDEDHCIYEPEKWETDPHDIKILKFTGVKRVGVWIHMYGNFYCVETSAGPALLHPNIDNGVVTLNFSRPGTFSSSNALRLEATPGVIAEMQRLKSELDRLR